MKWSIEKSKSLPPTVKQRFVKKFTRRISKDGELIIQSHRYRDQGRNVADCLHKLREMILLLATEPKKHKPVKISKAAKKRRVEAKRRKRPRQDD